MTSTSTDQTQLITTAKKEIETTLINIGATPEQLDELKTALDLPVRDVSQYPDHRALRLLQEDQDLATEMVEVCEKGGISANGLIKIMSSTGTGRGALTQIGHFFDASKVLARQGVKIDLAENADWAEFQALREETLSEDHEPSIARQTAYKERFVEEGKHQSSRLTVTAETWVNFVSTFNLEEKDFISVTQQANEFNDLFAEEEATSGTIEIKLPDGETIEDYDDVDRSLLGRIYAYAQGGKLEDALIELTIQGNRYRKSIYHILDAFEEKNDSESNFSLKDADEDSKSDIAESKIEQKISDFVASVKNGQIRWTSGTVEERIHALRVAISDHRLNDYIHEIINELEESGLEGAATLLAVDSGRGKNNVSMDEDDEIDEYEED